MSILATGVRIRRGRTSPALALLVLLVVATFAFVSALPASAQCTISGPNDVEEGAGYTLCGPTGYTYRWSGPGVASGVTARCITLSGRSTGIYEYTLALYSGGVLQDRCTHAVSVGKTPGPGRPEDTCTITGPTVIESGQTAELCGPQSTYQMHTYSWTGPGGFASGSRCISVTQAGVYSLTTSNQLSGHQRACSQRVEVRGVGVGDCTINGPETFEPGTPVRLCGPSGASSYRWTGPQGFVSNTSCITVSREGSYTVIITDRYGATSRCAHFLDSVQGSDDSEEVLAENCPRNHAFWSGVCRGSRTDVSAAELLSIARLVDERAQAFNWTNDVNGLSQALRPASPLTQRKQAMRQLATLLANLAAAELGITAQNGQTIGLDAETPLTSQNAQTIGELAALVDRMIVRGRGSFATANRTMQAVNGGRGIGPVCNE